MKKPKIKLTESFEQWRMCREHYDDLIEWEKYINYLEEERKLFIDILRLSKPYCLDTILDNSKDGLDKLLHRYDYDGNNWEELQHSSRQKSKQELTV